MFKKLFKSKKDEFTPSLTKERFSKDDSWGKLAASAETIKKFNLIKISDTILNLSDEDDENSSMGGASAHNLSYRRETKESTHLSFWNPRGVSDLGSAYGSKYGAAPDYANNSPTPDAEESDAAKCNCACSCMIL